MKQPPLNPDAIEAAADAVIDASFGQEIPEAPIDLATAAVSAYLAAVLPEVTSVEELDALPNGSAFRAKNNWIWEVQRVGYFITTGMNGPVNAENIHLPARVLYRPEVNDA